VKLLMSQDVLSRAAFVLLYLYDVRGISNFRTVRVFSSFFQGEPSPGGHS
jgi:hypothetical protein